MRKWAAILVLLPLACAGRRSEVDSAGHPFKKAEEIASGFPRAHSLALNGDNKYFISHVDDEGKGVISVWAKGKTQVFLKGLDNPSGIVVDSRRGLLFVNDVGTAKIFKIKKPEAMPVMIQVPVKARLSDVTFSLMNRRAYLMGEGEFTVWGIDPKKNKLEEVLPASVLEGLGLGVPTRLFPSSDGARLLVMMSGEKGSSLVSVSLKTKQTKVVREYGDAVELTGIDVGKNHLVLSAKGGAPVRAALLPKFEEVPMTVPDGMIHKPLSLVMDSTVAVVLDQLPESDSARVVQIPFHFKN